MSKSTTRSPVDDFDPKEAIQELSDNLNQPHKFAETFCEAAKTQKIIDDILKGIIKEVIQKDSDARDCIKYLVRDTNKENWRVFIAKIGVGLWTLIVMVITALVTALIQAYITGRQV
jgi:translation elongation factor EF-4